MIEARTITGEALKKADVHQVMALIREWQDNKHYGYNTIAILDYMLDAMGEALETIKQLEVKAGI